MPLPKFAPQTPWQMQYALPDWQQRLTRLSPQQEQQFQTWAHLNRAPITADYDMRGFWLHQFDPNMQTQMNANDGMMHYPDTYKTPLHESFSGESVYANPKAHPPTWNSMDQLVGADGRILYDERARNKQR